MISEQQASQEYVLKLNFLKKTFWPSELWRVKTTPVTPDASGYFSGVGSILRNWVTPATLGHSCISFMVDNIDCNDNMLMATNFSTYKHPYIGTSVHCDTLS
jgi:hypothetical protein